MNTIPKPRLPPLSAPHRRHGLLVYVQSYKRTVASGWTLKIVDQYERSTLWDGEFSSDTEAFQEFSKAIHQKGIEIFLDAPRRFTEREKRVLSEILPEGIRRN